jgi:serine/threonine protein kinase
VICPNCSAGEISPITHCCEMCGFVPDGAVVVESPHAETVDELARQELAERFRLDACLGRGATTAVYLARELNSDRQIVVKALTRPADGRAETDDRFARAVEAVAALEHPHIVPVFAHGSTAHLYWYSMEHVRGRSLREYLSSHGPLKLKPCMRIVTQVASALDHAHRLGVVHGALKPENVLIDAEGWVHVCDLMVAPSLKPAAPPAQAGAATADGTPAQMSTAESERPPYAAPEDLSTPFSDQYALAVLVYECLTQMPPPRSERSEVTPVASLATQRPDVPTYMAHAIWRALSPKPIDRFPGVLDFVAALETYSPPASEARPSGQTAGAVLIEPDWEPPPRTVAKKVLIAGGALVVVLAAGALALALRPSHPGLAPFASMPTDTASPAPRRPRPPSVADLEPRLPGRLFVNATPWGQLYVDGQLIGNTPRANISVDPGTHTVAVVREGYESYVKVIRVAPGDTVRITDIVLTPRSQ